MGRQEKASSELVSEPQQGLASHPARALLPRRLPAKLSKHSRASGRAGDRRERQRLLTRGWMWPCVPFVVWPSCLGTSSSPVRTTGLGAFLETHMVHGSVSPLQRWVLFLFSFCLESWGLLSSLPHLGAGFPKRQKSQIISAMWPMSASGEGT